MNLVIFDLDGTISDPAEGFVRSVNYALVELGCRVQPEERLLRYIGPHLMVTFSELIGTKDQATLARAIELYRDRYTTTGYRENYLYEGVPEVLTELVAVGSIVCLATTKHQDLAAQVLEFLKIDTCFTQVHGCDSDQPKADLLRDLLADQTLNQMPAVMIGDRGSDFLAATEVHIPSIAVRWGYGTEQEVTLATETVETPADLLEAILRIARPVKVPKRCR